MQARTFFWAAGVPNLLSMAIFQGDLVIRSALVEGIADLRKHPWMIDDIFAQCAQEASLSQEYGYKEIRRAREWFEAHDIPVVMDHRKDDIRLPCITVHLSKASEALDRTNLGDQGLDEFLGGDADEQVIDPKETEIRPVVILGPFTPESYNPTTGLITLPEGLDTTDVYPGQFVLATDGTAYEVGDVPSATSISITAGTDADLSGARVIPQFQTQVLRRELTYYRETYQLGLHVHGDPAQLFWLYSIIVFVLLRYKEALLEARGYSLSTFEGTDMIRNDAFEKENVYSRYIIIRGDVQYDWVKYVAQRIEGTRITGIKVFDPGDTPDALADDEEKQGWGTEG